MLTPNPNSEIKKIYLLLLNSWKNYEGLGYQKAIAYKNEFGEVRLSGLITVNWSEIMFILPEGWRPKNYLIFSCSSCCDYNDDGKRVDVKPDGTVFRSHWCLPSSGNGWVSLDGISFYT